jgi:hypothetical protein
MKNSLISIHFILIIITMTMLPFHVSAASKKIHIKDMVAGEILTRSVSFIASEPYFKGYYNDRGTLIFQTPTEMEISFLRKDKFKIDIWFDESDLRYLSQFESVDFIYPQGFISSDSNVTSYSTLNVPELLRVIKVAEKAQQKRWDNQPENRIKDFFGIDR